MKIQELFDQPYSVEWAEQTRDYRQAVFKTAKDHTVNIYFMRKENLWELLFDIEYRDPKTGVKVQTFSATGLGDAPKIFATVIKTILDFVKSENPDYLFFTSKEPSRTRLYQTLARKLLEHYNRITDINQSGLSDKLRSSLKIKYDTTSEGFFLLANKDIPLEEVTIDNREGAGAVPDNLNVDYLGLRVQMKPSMFLKLAAKLSSPRSAADLADYIKQGGAIGAPFLNIELPEEWLDDEPNYDKPARIVGHEGRNRMIAVQQVDGDDPVEVHLFFRGGLRRRHLTPEIIKRLQYNVQGIYSQDKNLILDVPLFVINLEESNFVLNELFAKPYTWEQIDNETYGFETAVGKKYKVLIVSESIPIEGVYKRGYWVEFGLVRFGGYEYQIERTGDAFNVFATVAAIVKQHLATAQPVDYIFFTASEPSRVKLYDAFMKLVPRFLPGWEFYKAEAEGEDRKYILKSTSAEDS